jgi:hypothetical protein
MFKLLPTAHFGICASFSAAEAAAAAFLYCYGLVLLHSCTATVLYCFAVQFLDESGLHQAAPSAAAACCL